jgi:methylphosphotriester-DNA--protein-cysteine methyltransferase
VLEPETVSKIQHIVETSTNDDALVNAIEAGLLCRLQQRSTRLSPIIRAVQDLLATQAINRVDDLGVRVETSPRQLERLTKNSYGFSPKTVLRRARVLRTIQAMKGYAPVDWEMQAEQDFADQSHLIHEFRHFTGRTPHTYQQLCSPVMDAAHAMQSALLRKMRMPHSADSRVKVQMYGEGAEGQVRALAASA